MRNKIFKKENKIVIGMVHFPPLFGYKAFPGMDACLSKALEDARILEENGVDGIIVENNYDIPHKVFVEDGTIEMMTALTKAVAEAVSFPIGVSVLWNDYKAGFRIAKECGCRFIRVPVFVDSVKTQYDKILAEPEKVLAYREEVKASEVALFTDIHVKHAEMLEQKSTAESAKEAALKGSDALIITGKWTGDMPDLNELKEARETVGKDFPIFVGSGATQSNVRELLKYANGVIVGTSLKAGLIQPKENEINLKPWQAKISPEKTKELVITVNK